MESSEGREPTDQVEMLQDCCNRRGAAKSLCRQLAAHCLVARGMAMPKALLSPGKEKGSPRKEIQSALSKIKM